MIKVNKISNQSSPVFDLRTPDAADPKDALVRWQQQNFPEQMPDDFTILVNDKMEVLRHPSQDPLLPDTKYIVIFRSLWQDIVKFMSSTKKDRHTGKSRFNMEELLLNNKLQIYARTLNEQGDSKLFDLYTNFLAIASRPGVNPLGREKREKIGQFKMVKIGLHLLATFISVATPSELLEIKTRAHEIRETPSHFRPKGGLCMIGGLLIILIEGAIIGVIQIIQFIA